jgi:hypothetical protein
MRLGGYAVVLVSMLAGGWGVGRIAEASSGHTVAEPVHGHDLPPPSSPSSADPGGSGPMAGMTGPAGQAAGLSDRQDGYRLVLTSTEVPVATDSELRFTVLGPDGNPVTQYQVLDDRELHLFVVRRDLSDYQHLHPTRATDGTWSTPLRLPEAGTYRVLVNLTPLGHVDPLVLGADLAVAGVYAPHPAPGPQTVWTEGGYQVEAGGVPAGPGSSPVTFTFSRDGAPLRDLDPYLGAFGHLVVLRGDDLGFAHAHPQMTGQPGQLGGPTLTFGVEFPAAGRYRLFLDFSEQGQVRTAEYTFDVSQPAPAQPAADPTNQEVGPS